MTCQSCARARAHMPAAMRTRLEAAERWFEARRLERKAQKRVQKNREPISLISDPNNADREPGA